MKKLLFITTALVAFGAGPAHADPISAAIGGWIASSFAVSAATALAIGQVIVGIGTSIISNALTKALAPKPEAGRQSYDVKFDVDLADDSPLTFCVGQFATAGKRKYLGSWGRETRFMTDVIEVSCLPQGFNGLWVDDERAEFVSGKLGAINASAPRNWIGRISDYNDGSIPAGWLEIGRPVTNYMDAGDEGTGYRIYLKWVDGNQTAADPLLVHLFGDDADYPWTADMIGTGKSYAIITTRYDDDTLQQYPKYLIEPAPIALYDPRKDSTVGGSGPHRWGDGSTHEATLNPAVIAYNIARGIYYGSEWVFGGKNMAAWRLPLDEWFAAMNECDATVSLSDGSTEPAYRCGMEIEVSTEPLSVMEELGKAANMRFAEVGGVLKPCVGLPGSSVFSITDEDILITEGQSFTPFSPVSDTFNALSATYPEPAEKWANKDAPEYVSVYWTAEDDGRYLPTSLSYSAVPFADQVQRLMRSQMEDYRRMRLHSFQLHPGAYALEPLDMITWDSARNGYQGKQFVVESVTKLPGMCVAVNLRESDPADYDWSTDFELPYTTVPPSNVIPWTQGITGWGAEAAMLTDAGGTDRRPAVRVWCDADSVGVSSVRIQISKTDSGVLFDLTRPYDEPYTWMVSDVAPATTYQVRGTLLSDLTPLSDWSDWISVTTGDIASDTAALAAKLDSLNTWIDETRDIRETLNDTIGEMQELASQGKVNLDSLETHLVVQMEDQAAEYRERIFVIAGEQQAMVLTMEELTATVGENSASITNAQQALVDQEQALANQQTYLQSFKDGNTAEGMFRLETMATPTGALSRLGFKVTATLDEAASARSAAFYMEAVAGGISRVIFQAGQFAFALPDGVTFPFYTSGNAVYIDNAVIANGSISSAQIENGSITNAKIANASITSAKIQEATIDTINIKPGAFTKQFITPVGEYIGDNTITWTTTSELNWEFPVVALGRAQVKVWSWDGGSGGAAYMSYRVFLNGTQVANGTVPNKNTTVQTVFEKNWQWDGGGNNTLTVQCRSTGNTGYIRTLIDVRGIVR